jgi:general stress protein CsbA
MMLIEGLVFIIGINVLSLIIKHLCLREMTNENRRRNEM